MKKAPVSVVVPSFNHGAYIEEALDSILTQSFPPEEIVIVDDGSSDDTRRILETYRKHAKVIYNDVNIGAALTTNIGIQAATQNYICILNSDDRWKNNKLDIQYDFLKTNKLDVSFGLADVIDGDSNFVTEPPIEFQNFRRVKPSENNYLKHFFYKGNFLCHPTIMISKTVYQECGLYNNRFRQLPDFEMWIRIAKSSYSMGVCPEALIDFRWTPGSNTSDQSKFANFARTQNEHLLIFGRFFTGLSRDIVSEVFSRELASIFRKDPEYQGIDPALVLLLNHEDKWLGSAAKLAGIQQIFESDGDESQDLFIQRILSEGYWSMHQSNEIFPAKNDFKTIKNNLFKLRKFFISTRDFK